MGDSWRSKDYSTMPLPTAIFELTEDLWKASRENKTIEVTFLTGILVSFAREAARQLAERGHNE